jgi:DNA-binding MarR family transcriptional regulator
VTRSTKISSRSPGTGLAKVIDTVGLLWRAPRTVTEVHRLTGVTYGIVSRHFTVLEAEGLIVRDGERNTSAVYKWVDRS